MKTTLLDLLAGGAAGGLPALFVFDSGGRNGRRGRKPRPKYQKWASKIACYDSSIRITGRGAARRCRCVSWPAPMRARGRSAAHAAGAAAHGGGHGRHCLFGQQFFADCRLSADSGARRARRARHVRRPEAHRGARAVHGGRLLSRAAGRRAGLESRLSGRELQRRPADWRHCVGPARRQVRPPTADARRHCRHHVLDSALWL